MSRFGITRLPLFVSLLFALAVFERWAPGFAFAPVPPAGLALRPLLLSLPLVWPGRLPTVPRGLLGRLLALPSTLRRLRLDTLPGRLLAPLVPVLSELLLSGRLVRVRWLVRL